MVIAELIIELIFGLIVGSGEACISDDFYDVISNENVKLSRRKLILCIVSILQILFTIVFAFIVLSETYIFMRVVFGILLLLLLYKSSRMWTKIIRYKPFK